MYRGRERATFNWVNWHQLNAVFECNFQDFGYFESTGVNWNQLENPDTFPDTTILSLRI